MVKICILCCDWLKILATLETSTQQLIRCGVRVSVTIWLSRVMSTVGKVRLKIKNRCQAAWVRMFSSLIMLKAVELGIGSTFLWAGNEVYRARLAPFLLTWFIYTACLELTCA